MGIERALNLPLSETTPAKRRSLEIVRKSPEGITTEVLPDSQGNAYHAALGSDYASGKAIDPGKPANIQSGVNRYRPRRKI